MQETPSHKGGGGVALSKTVDIDLKEAKRKIYTAAKYETHVTAVRAKTSKGLHMHAFHSLAFLTQHAKHVIEQLWSSSKALQHVAYIPEINGDPAKIVEA